MGPFLPGGRQCRRSGRVGIRTEQLSVLRDTNVSRLPKPSRTKDNVRAVFDYPEQHPIIEIKRTSAALGISYNTDHWYQSVVFRPCVSQ